VNVALASPPVAATLDEGLAHVQRAIAEAAAGGAAVVCFPEAYLPGLRGLDFPVPPFTLSDQNRVLADAGAWAAEHHVAVVLGMEWIADEGRQIVSAVFGRDGAFLGVQTKNQLDPTEEPNYVPGHERRLFTVDGLTFGIAICHEGFRYPETVRWAAARGAQLVFHPQCTGSDLAGPTLTAWGSTDAPYYERAVMCRGLENTIYVASVNYGFRYQESATTLVGPTGACVAHLPYGRPGVLVQEVDLAAATGLLAGRYAPERYAEADAA
jgi:predicted amidohydrolase